MNTLIHILTTSEIRAITGTPTRRLQIDWLIERSWPHEVNHFGFPVVLRSLALERLGAEPQSEAWDFNDADVA